MSHTLAQLEAFVSSSAYDAETAGLIARGIPALKATDGELISPGVRRIRGNLCNVHGRYGPCDKGLSGKKKPSARRTPAKARQTPAQRAQARTQQRQQNTADVAKRMAETDTGLSPSGVKALASFATGQQPDETQGAGLAQMGLAERASDGTYRMTPTGRAVVSAMAAGDYQRTVDAISRGTDAQGKRTERGAAQAKRQQDAAGKRTSAAMGRELAKRERENAAKRREAERATKKPTKASAGGSKKPEKPAVEKPRRAPAKRQARSSMPSAGGAGGAAPAKKPKPAKPAKAPAKQIAPALQTAADQLSQGVELSAANALALIRNGLAKENKEGVLVLTAAGMRATQKDIDPKKTVQRLWASGVKQSDIDGIWYSPSDGAWFVSSGDWAESDVGEKIKAVFGTGVVWADEGVPSMKPGSKEIKFTQRLKSADPRSFRVFKDASGRYRWVAQSSTAFQDRDREIVSTKALADDCQFADKTGSYGPLRWWHAPGLDLGDCDFNAMHGRVLIESGTFRSEAIALKVAQSAPQLEISLGFLHLPTEPDANGVFHHIRRFERSLVPRGKASNRFTAFRVKEIPMLDATKVAALKTLGFSDDDITSLQSQAAATEKSADAQRVAYKADEPAPPDEITIGGVVYTVKAFPPSPPTEADAVVEEDAIEEMPTEEEVPAEGGLTLSPEDLAAIGEAIGAQMQGIAAQIMGALDLEKKVAGHVQGLLAPYQATKDAEQALKDVEKSERDEKINQLQSSLKSTQDKLNELLGLQPEVAPRASESATTTINPWMPQDQQLLQAVKDQVSPSDQFAFGDLVQNLFGNQTPGQA